MCELCGGPHFTCLCPNYMGSSASPCVTNSFTHVQTYYSQECQSSQDGAKYLEEKRREDEKKLRDQLKMVQEMIMHSWNESTDDDKRKLLEVYGLISEELEKYKIIQPETTKEPEIMERYVVKGNEDLPPAGIYEFSVQNDSSSDDEDDWDFSCNDLHHDPEPGKYSELQSEYPNFDIPAPVTLIEDELESSSSFNFSCLFVEDDDAQELEVKNEREEDVKEVPVPSWEDEFAEELVDLPVMDEGEFDPLGDLKILEDLVYNQMPSVGMDIEPSGPEGEVDNESSQSTKPRDKAKKEPRERTQLQIGRWVTRMKKPLKCKHDRTNAGGLTCSQFLNQLSKPFSISILIL